MKLDDFMRRHKKLEATCVKDVERLTKGKVYRVQPVGWLDDGKFHIDLPWEEAPEVRVVSDDIEVIKVDKSIFQLKE